MRLAASWGVSIAALDRLDEWELAHWRQFDAMGGFGERRADLRMAKMTAHLIAAIPFGGKREITVEEFMLSEGTTPNEAVQDGDEHLFDSFDAATARSRGKG